MHIRRFDPWQNKFCTCPTKYSLNPYTGCSHGCVYCYGSSYIKDFFKCREKNNLIENIKREIKKIHLQSVISLSNTSDPYPPMELDKRITRKCLEIFKEHGIKVLIITKSDIVCRDIDLLKDMEVAVTITITTLKYYEKIEPHAPTPFKRLTVLEKLSREGIQTGLRLDPIIPSINDDEIEQIINLAKSAGIRHVTASTFKPRWDSWKRLMNLFPERKDNLKDLYLIRGKKLGNSYYLDSSLRESIIAKVGELCSIFGLTFSTCRENLPKYGNSKSCDGSHLIFKSSG
ncbi:MAG: radical SAM protein [Thermodesulfovibrionales bacterium]|nr:radical SAM protein [Thermodesulfovibrionales bacterium]